MTTSSFSIAAMVPRTRGSSGGRKPTTGINSRTRVELAAAKALREGVAAGVESLLANRRMHVVADSSPTLQWCLQFEPLRIAHCAIQRHPRHDFGKSKVAATASYFPNSLVRLFPDLLQVFDELLLLRPTRLGRSEPRFRAW